MFNAVVVGSGTVAGDERAVIAPGETGERAQGAMTEAFIASMPKRYRHEFSRGAMQEHARIVTARGRRPVHADLFYHTSADGPGLCVVAPDRSGLLAAISSALMLEDFDITRADAYTRKVGSGDYEAVDFFWVRRTSSERTGPLGEADVAAVERTLVELLRGDRLYGASRARSLVPSPGVSETSVRFSEHHDAPWITLELESNDRPGLLAVVTDTLAREGMQIVDCRIRTHGLRVMDTFDIIEANGTPPMGASLQRLELAVLTAVDGA